MSRSAWGVLSAAASVLLLLCSVYLLKGSAGGVGAAPVFVVGLGLLAAAFKSLKPRHLG